MKVAAQWRSLSAVVNVNVVFNSENYINCTRVFVPNDPRGWTALSSSLTGYSTMLTHKNYLWLNAFCFLHCLRVHYIYNNFYTKQIWFYDTSCIKLSGIYCLDFNSVLIPKLVLMLGYILKGHLPDNILECLFSLDTQQTELLASHCRQMVDWKSLINIHVK